MVEQTFKHFWTWNNETPPKTTHSWLDVEALDAATSGRCVWDRGEREPLQTSPVVKHVRQQAAHHLFRHDLFHYKEYQWKVFNITWLRQRSLMSQTYTRGSKTRLTYQTALESKQVFNTQVLHHIRFFLEKWFHHTCSKLPWSWNKESQVILGEVSLQTAGKKSNYSQYSKPAFTTAPLARRRCSCRSNI